MYLQVDGDTSTNDAVIALASGLSGSKTISTLNSSEAEHLQLCLDTVSSLTLLQWTRLAFDILKKRLRFSIIVD